MTPISKPIVFFGTEDFSATSLAHLLELGLPVRLVITKPDTPRGRKRHLTPPAVKQLAQQHNIPVLQPHALAEIVPQIVALDRPVGVLVSFGRIIPQAIIDLFSPGIINLHPSLLPRYRGPTPIESAILHGDSVTGVSIMQLSARMDAGPVYSQATHQLTGRESQAELYKTLGQLGSQELGRWLPKIIAGAVVPQPQDESAASYCQLLTKADGLVPDTTQYSARQLERRIRAYSHYPKTRLHLYGQPRIVTKAQVASAPSDSTIACQGNTWLEIKELVAPSGRRMTLQAFLRGWRGHSEQ